MIKANELRLGNLLLLSENVGYNFKGIVEVISINKTGINPWQDMGASGLISFDKLTGIPLTEEWLEKFGFNKTVDKQLETITISNNGSEGKAWIENISFSNNEITLQYEHNKYYYNNLNVTYVHQLQNLYFALTGEELIVKELAT